MIKEAWMPPKRLWGQLSERAWKILKKQGFIKSDKEILKGIQEGNEILLGLRPNRSGKFYTKLRDAGIVLKYKSVGVRGVRDLVMGTLKKDPISIQSGISQMMSFSIENKVITAPNRRFSVYKKILRSLGLHDPIGLRHEIDEARISMKKPRDFKIAIEYNNILLPTTNHSSPEVLFRESNLMRGLSKRHGFMKLRKINGESRVIKRYTGKEYGKDYFTKSDLKKIPKDKLFIVEKNGVGELPSWRIPSWMFD